MEVTKEKFDGMLILLFQIDEHNAGKALFEVYKKIFFEERICSPKSALYLVPNFFQHLKVVKE